MLGSFTSEVGLTVEAVDNNCIPNIGSQRIKKGLALELFRYAKSQYGVNKAVEKCKLWLGLLSGNSTESISDSVLKTKLYKVEKDKKSKGGTAAKSFLEELFVIPIQSATSRSPDPTFSPFPIEPTVVTTPNTEFQSFRKENILLKRKLVRRDERIEKEKKIKLDFKKIQSEKESILKRNQKQAEAVQTLKTEISQLKEQVEEKGSHINTLEINNAEIGETLCESVTLLEEANIELQTTSETIRNLKDDNDYLQSLLSDNAPLNTWDEHKNAFNTDVVQCIMNLLSCNVAAANVSEVIQHVCRLCDRHPSHLPSRQTVDRINDMRVCVSQKQLESLSERENLTLYSDETSKFGKSFEVFALSDEQKNTYLLGLREMYSKCATSVLDTFKEILGDIDNISETTDVGHKILAAIKNTMSDRAATEKKFQSLLESYRMEILPKVQQGWNGMNKQEQESCGKMNNFFCGLHILVNFAEVCAEALRKFEHLMSESKVGAEVVEESEKDSEKSELQKEESGTVRLIRCSSKAFAKGADEKSGVYGEFKTYVESQNDKLRFIRFKHNRFNILFLIGDITYHHRLHIKDYLENYQGATNRLLRTILADINVPMYLAGCRALGIISKLVTGPLWRAIENTGHILEMNDTLKDLHNFLEIAKTDSSKVLSGELKPFDSDESKLEVLEENSELDQLTVLILQCLFEAMFLLLKRQASDHLQGGKYFRASSDVWDESTSSLRHNKLPEFFFGQLDFLMKYRPNASTLCNEAFILFTHNRTGEWLASIDTAERERLMNESRTEGRRIRKCFQERIKHIEALRLEQLRKKQHEIKERKHRLFQRKEKMTNDILYFGLWQSENDIEENLREISQVSEQTKALKAQLTFRKSVLLQTPSDKSLFLFSVAKKNRTLEELKANLLKLIEESKLGETRETVRDKRQPLLVGKTVKHKFEDKWYIGKVLSVVPGFGEWYNVKYEDDEALYVYKLQEDYSNGDLQIIPQAQA